MKIERLAITNYKIWKKNCNKHQAHEASMGKLLAADVLIRLATAVCAPAPPSGNLHGLAHRTQTKSVGIDVETMGNVGSKHYGRRVLGRRRILTHYVRHR